MNTRHIRFTRLSVLALLLVLVLAVACSPATPAGLTAEPVRDNGASDGALAEVTPAAEPTTAALEPAPTAAATATAAPTAAGPQPTASPEAYPDAVEETLPDAYPAPALAESLEGYPGVSVVEAPEGLDLDPATLGTSLPALLERFVGGGEELNSDALEDDPLLTLIVADAAARSGTEPSALALVSVEAVTWPDTSLGCPDPERGYAQVQIEGYILTLTDGVDSFIYHTDGGLQLVLCQDGAPLAVSVAPER